MRGKTDSAFTDPPVTTPAFTVPCETVMGGYCDGSYFPTCFLSVRSHILSHVNIEQLLCMTNGLTQSSAKHSYESTVLAGEVTTIFLFTGQFKSLTANLYCDFLTDFSEAFIRV